MTVPEADHVAWLKAAKAEVTALLAASRAAADLLGRISLEVHLADLEEGLLALDCLAILDREKP